MAKIELSKGIDAPTLGECQPYVNVDVAAILHPLLLVTAGRIF